MKECYECKIELKNDEIALNKKLLGKKIQQFLCIDCLGEYLETDRDILIEKVEQFKDEGCTLFS